MADEKTLRDKFFEAQASAALWDVAVSLKRGNALPLDANSVFKSLDDVNTYRNGGGPAYPGQVLSVVGTNETTIYYLDQELNVKPVGVIPTGDSKTIEVSASGAISLLGSAGAENGTLPMLENGALVWKTLEDIGAGDGNDDTTYQFSFANEKITIKPLFNGQPIKDAEDDSKDVVYELDLSNFVTADELDNVIGKAAEGETAATGLYKVIADALSEAKTYADENDANDNTTYTLHYGKNPDDETDEKQYIYIKDSANVVSKIDASIFIADGVLNNVEYDAENDKLIFIWNTIDLTTGDLKKVEVDVKDLVDTYTPGNGLALENNAFSVKVDGTSESFLTVGADGVKLSGVQTAIDTAALNAKNDAIAAAAADATTKAGTAKSEAIADAATKYYGKGDLYTKGEIDELLEGIQGGASESAASVKTQLDAYKKVVNAEVWGDEAGAGVDGNSRIDILDTKVKALEDVGAQANVIDKVEGTAENRLSVSTSGKTVTIDDSNLRTDINEAKTIGSNAAAAAKTNGDAIKGHDTRIGNLETAKEEQAGQILALQNADTSAKNRLSALETSVNNEVSGLAATHAKSVQNATDIATLNAKDKTHDEDIAALKTSTGNNTTAITNLQSAVANVYTKTEADGKFVVKEDGKSLIATSEIERLAGLKNYDDTAVKALIQGNTDAIAALYKPASGDTAATGIVVDLVKAEETRATGVENGLKSRIETVEAFWAEAIRDGNEKNVIDTLKEIQDYIASDETGAAAMADSIRANAEAIAAIYTPATEGNAASGVLVNEIARVEGKADTNAAAITAINHAETGILATAKKHTDEEIAKVSAASVSTDRLVNGTKELILSAGNANGYNV